MFVPPPAKLKFIAPLFCRFEEAANKGVRVARTYVADLQEMAERKKLCSHGPPYRQLKEPEGSTKQNETRSKAKRPNKSKFQSLKRMLKKIFDLPKGLNGRANPMKKNG